MAEDNWHYHFYDTVKGSDWLGDQDAIEFMCREAPKVVYELEHFGMPFDRNPDGTIYQRPFGGHTANYGEKPVQRACAAADRTGHAMLHTLYQQNVKARTNFFVEWMALDLIRDADGDVLGVTALEMETGDVHILEAKTTLFATGGAGRIFAASTNAFINTGDGLGMAARAGIPLEDMEFWQFHPTGVAGAGVLLTEGCRGEGAILRNADGERFMERYAPDAEGPGAARLRLALHGPGDQGRARLRSEQGLHPPRHDAPGRRHHPEAPAQRVRDRPQLRQRRHHEGTDSRGADHPLPDGWHPDQHPRPGGGMPKNGNPNSVVNGFYAVGECACVSVHGANRLGTNSLLDLLVFGRAAGNHIVDSFKKADVAHKPLPADAADATLARLARLDAASDRRIRPGRGERPAQRDAAARRRVPHPGHHGRWRREGGRRSPKRVKAIGLKDKSKVFNTARIEALEVDNLIEAAQATMVSAAARKESRGAHSVDDYGDTPEHPNGRNDEVWMKHTLWYSEGNRLDYKPVQLKPLTVESVPPEGPHVLIETAP